MQIFSFSYALLLFETTLGLGKPHVILIYSIIILIRTVAAKDSEPGNIRIT